MPYFVYILASRPGGALYVGMTSDLRRRVEQHRAKAVGGHTATYNIGALAWFEIHASLEEARARERSIKRWRRSWKERLILDMNPEWKDISSEIPL